MPKLFGRMHRRGECPGVEFTSGNTKNELYHPSHKNLVAIGYKQKRQNFVLAGTKRKDMVCVGLSFLVKHNDKRCKVPQIVTYLYLVKQLRTGKEEDVGRVGMKFVELNSSQQTKPET